ncbi:hypothetical protein HETIRDRAFT_171491 [Heterobasidion irregulare TC 32-1]|uniref:Uncharacterized protein n=1 Tax=Heterobasidion irregulare (strain TC 32-1) TaxID=747525 RepID=W4K3U2_HETIT|nr:uncharacterized protein HETIRDRAFT_171491 [Heterobasidion irregulare TC 32-1]ETW80010.1 hypothetical protein HETIRDRAFT_171491 [Heterobasidion irregulare TC 32-1]
MGDSSDESGSVACSQTENVRVLLPNPSMICCPVSLNEHCHITNRCGAASFTFEQSIADENSETYE